eukprot:TRINITY_DN504_c0_g1_i1.p1 TRINITY_DN504_c0_g1~~TRINITY_DN504_c0_g1_i1.p1  ORF type:complete len:331 (-),score=48.53 TRINITY_DN504_c0_g1_i1:196-1188(-)
MCRCNCLGPRGWITIVLVSLSVILFVVLMPLSFAVIQFDEVGIRYNKVSRELASSYDTEGRHYVAPGEVYFLFKRRFITYNFIGNGNDDDTDVTNADVLDFPAIDCITSDGVIVTASITLQFTLLLDKLVDLLKDYGFEFNGVIVRQVRASVRSACSSHTVTEFYENRGLVQDTILNKTKTALLGVYCSADFLQLTNAEFPPDYSSAVNSKAQAAASVQQAFNERQQALIASQTQVLQATQQAFVTVTQASAAAEGTLAIARADAAGIELLYNATASAYGEMMQALDLTPQQLINYIGIEQLGRATSIVASVQPPAKFSFPESSGANATI